MRIRPIDSAGIILSYRCGSRCRHCLYACGPERKGSMRREDLRMLLSGIKRAWERYPPAPSGNILFEGVHLAGGEPFLDYPLLLDAVEETVEVGVPLGYIETNAAWCTDREAAHEKFTALRRAGLTRVLVSCSPFHAEKIPLKKTILAVEIASEVFGPGRVIVYMQSFLPLISGFAVNEPVPLEKWVEAYGEETAGRIFWQGYGLIPGGRSGFRLGHLQRRYEAGAFARQSCLSEICESRHAHFDLERNYVPYFCGGLSLGDARDLPGFYDAFDWKSVPLAALLVEGGPCSLMRLAADRFGYSERPEGYVGKCHLCVDVRRHIREKTGDFRELAPKGFYEAL